MLSSVKVLTRASVRRRIISTTAGRRRNGRREHYVCLPLSVTRVSPSICQVSSLLVLPKPALSDTKVRLRMLVLVLLVKQYEASQGRVLCILRAKGIALPREPCSTASRLSIVGPCSPGNPRLSSGIGSPKLRVTGSASTGSKPKEGGDLECPAAVKDLIGSSYSNPC